MSTTRHIEGYVACRGCQLKSVAVENISCEIEVGIFQVEIEVVASRSLKGHAQLLLDWLKNAVVGVNRALWKEPHDRQLSYQA